jgi:hypothetical protein
VKSVRVNKEELIERLKENRRNHRKLFLKAQKRYRKTVIAELDKRLKAARENGVIDLGFFLPEPKDFTQEYTNAIQALEWSLDDEVTLDEREFNRLVLNQWEWAQQFAASTAAYLGS